MPDKTALQTTRRRVLEAGAALVALFAAPAAAEGQAGDTEISSAKDAEATMRMMMRLTMPVDSGNAAIRSGAWDQTLDHIIETLKPEAAYFYLEGGQRAAMFVYEADTSETMATINEPIFQALGASIEQQPVLTAADLGKALHPQ